MENNLTEGNIWKSLLYFAMPIFGANLLQAMYGTVDLMIVGNYADKCAVSAVSTGSMTLQTITGIILGLTMGCTVLLGQKIGMKDHKGAAHTVASSFGLFVGLGIILTFIVVLASNGITSVMNAPQEAFRQTSEYIRICGYGIICIVLFNALSGIFRGIGDSKTPFLLMMVACIVNMIGDYLLVGTFDMGSDGAAIATVFAQGISVIFALLLIKKNGMGFPCEKSSLKPRKEEIVHILKYGLPIAAQEALTGVSFMVILAILNTFGVIASAGVGVAERICGLMFIVPGAMMSAVSAFCAQNYGAGKIKRAKKGMIVSMVVTVTVGIVMFLISYTKGVWLSQFFSNDLDVCKASADYLRSYSIDCMIVGINFSLMGYFNGIGKTAFVAIQGILSTFLVRIPVSYYMSLIPGVSLFQVGFATPLATIFAIVITVVYYFNVEKKGKA